MFVEYSKPMTMEIGSQNIFQLYMGAKMKMTMTFNITEIWRVENGTFI